MPPKKLKGKQKEPKSSPRPPTPPRPSVPSPAPSEHIPIAVEKPPTNGPGSFDDSGWTGGGWPAPGHGHEADMDDDVDDGPVGWGLEQNPSGWEMPGQQHVGRWDDTNTLLQPPMHSQGSVLPPIPENASSGSMRDSEAYTEGGETHQDDWRSRGPSRTLTNDSRPITPIQQPPLAALSVTALTVPVDPKKYSSASDQARRYEESKRSTFHPPESLDRPRNSLEPSLHHEPQTTKAMSSASQYAKQHEAKTKRTTVPPPPPPMPEKKGWTPQPDRPLFPGGAPPPHLDPDPSWTMSGGNIWTKQRRPGDKSIPPPEPGFTQEQRKFQRDRMMHAAQQQQHARFDLPPQSYRGHQRHQSAPPARRDTASWRAWGKHNSIAVESETSEEEEDETDEDMDDYHQHGGPWAQPMHGKGFGRGQPPMHSRGGRGRRASANDGFPGQTGSKAGGQWPDPTWAQKSRETFNDGGGGFGGPASNAAKWARAPSHTSKYTQPMPTGKGAGDWPSMGGKSAGQPTWPAGGGGGGFGGEMPAAWGDKNNSVADGGWDLPGGGGGGGWDTSKGGGQWETKASWDEPKAGQWTEGKSAWDNQDAGGDWPNFGHDAGPSSFGVHGGSKSRLPQGSLNGDRSGVSDLQRAQIRNGLLHGQPKPGARQSSVPPKEWAGRRNSAWESVMDDGFTEASDRKVHISKQQDPWKSPLVAPAAMLQSPGISPTVAEDLRKIPLSESHGAALENVRLAFYGSERLARERLYWIFPPDKDARVDQTIKWVMSTGKDVLGLYGLLKFCESRERGGIFINAAFRLQGKPQTPVVDWLTFDHLRSTMDKTLQESVAFYSPMTTAIVFVYLPSASGQSLAIWRRKVTVPEAYRNRYQAEVTSISRGLRKEKEYVCYVDEMPRTRTKSGNLKGGQPAFFVKNGAKMVATPLLPGEKKKKKKWWKLFSK